MRTMRANMSVGRRVAMAHRRGSIYVMVLMVSLIVLVIGLGSVMVSRSAARATMGTSDWSEAGIGAQSGVEYAVAVMNSSATWRTDTSSGAVIAAPDVGRAKVRVSIVDEADGNLGNNPGDSARVYGAATVGSTSRAYSVQVAPASTRGMDLLRCPIYSQGNISVTANSAAAGGPMGCAAAISNSAQLTADIETKDLSSTGFIAGYVQTGITAKSLPATSVWTTLMGNAIPIPFASLAGGTMDRAVVTSLTNTYGSANSRGVYSISVPALSTLTIRRSRIEATLLVTLGASAKLIVQDENLWDPYPGNPSLLVQGALLSSVTLGGSSTNAALSEAVTGTNYNPVGAPYLSVTDSDTLDTYASELHGVIHIMDSIPVTIGSNLKVVGCVIATGTVAISGAATLAANPTLLTSPPTGYSDTGTVKMAPVPGTYKWEVADVNPG